VARTSNNRVIMACELHCCLLPQCEALRTCRSGFPIATLLTWFNIFPFGYFEQKHLVKTFKSNKQSRPLIQICNTRFVQYSYIWQEWITVAILAFFSEFSGCLFNIAWYCCDRKARAEYAQSFAPRQQATIEIMRRNHSTIACSRHIYMGVVLRAHPVRGPSVYSMKQHPDRAWLCKVQIKCNALPRLTGSGVYTAKIWLIVECSEQGLSKILYSCCSFPTVVVFMKIQLLEILYELMIWNWSCNSELQFFVIFVVFKEMM